MGPTDEEEGASFPRTARANRTLRATILRERRRWGIPRSELARVAGVSVGSIRKFIDYTGRQTNHWQPHRSWLDRVEAALVKICRRKARLYLAGIDKEFAGWDGERRQRKGEKW